MLCIAAIKRLKSCSGRDNQVHCVCNHSCGVSKIHMTQNKMRILIFAVSLLLSVKLKKLTVCFIKSLNTMLWRNTENANFHTNHFVIIIFSGVSITWLMIDTSLFLPAHYELKREFCLNLTQKLVLPHSCPRPVLGGDVTTSHKCGPAVLLTPFLQTDLCFTECWQEILKQCLLAMIF
jgi:hypothetical protein